MCVDIMKKLPGTKLRLLYVHTVCVMRKNFK